MIKEKSCGAVVYKIVNNQIIIDLLKPVKEEKLLEDEEKELVDEYYQVSKIIYNIQNKEHNGWLYNENEIPVLPFIIEVGK